MLPKARDSRVKEVQKDLRRHASPSRAITAAKYFKAMPGEYGHGDKFLGVKVPMMRTVAKRWAHLSLDEVAHLLTSEWHEDRSLGFAILELQFNQAQKIERADRALGKQLKTKLFQFLWKHRRFANNWDLIDGIFIHVVGPYFFENPKTMKVYWPKLYKSPDMWEQRMSIVLTHYFIRMGQFKQTLFVGKHFLNSKFDLIHKASGWMLREAGKRDLSVLIKFLNTNAHRMPRTMLRYSIEKLPPKKRKYYLAYSSTPTS